MLSVLDRKRILLFVAITYGIAIALALVIYLNDGLFRGNSREVAPLAATLLTATMFAPAFANLATRLLTREGWANTLLRPNLRRGWRLYLAAWILPALAILAGGAIYYLLFPGKFDPTMQWARQQGLVPGSMTWGSVVSQTLLIGLLYAPFAPLNIFKVFGEEFGWRAYLLPKLLPLGPRKAALLGGVIWAAFHWPVILMGYEYGFGYWGAPVTGLLLFVVVMIFPNILLSWVTLRAGSVWPAVIAHAVNNSILSMLMVYFHRGAWNPLVGPVQIGIVGCLGYALLALPLCLLPRALAPAQPAPAPKLEAAQAAG